MSPGHGVRFLSLSCEPWSSRLALRRQDHRSISVGAQAKSKPTESRYPTTDQWDTGLDGIKDAGAHVISMARQCPGTKMVLGGYSQGAAVMGFVTSAAIPNGVDPATVPKPMAPEVANHVSSVVLFGLPNVRAMNFLGEPPVVIGPL